MPRDSCTGAKSKLCSASTRKLVKWTITEKDLDCLANSSAGLWLICIERKLDRMARMTSSRSCTELHGSELVQYLTLEDKGTNEISYLIRKRWVDLSLEHAQAASFCFRYLTSTPFLSAIDNQVSLYARQGYYALQDYSVQYFLDHFLHAIGKGTSDAAQTAPNTMKSARDFLKSYNVSTNLPWADDEVSTQEIVQFFKKIPKDQRDRAGAFDIADRTVRIRSHIEVVRSQTLTNEELDIINNLYGFETTFKCPKLWCNYFTIGFLTSEERKKHVICHERPFCCPKEDCIASRSGFDAQEKLKQHMDRQHSPLSLEVRFPKKLAKERNIHNAAATGDMAAVLAFLDSGVDPNRSDGFSGPLYSAASSNQFEVCKQLLARGAKIFDWETAASTTNAPAMQSALQSGSLEVVYLFLCQPELETSEGIQELPRWIADACLSSNAEVLELLLESNISRHIDIDNFSEDERKQILGACTDNDSEGSLRCLLDHGFSKLVTPDVFFRAESQAREDLVDLLRPIVDNMDPPYSMQRVEHLLSYLELDSTYLSESQMTVLQNRGPAEQRKFAKRYENALAQQWDMGQKEAQARITSFPPLQFQKNQFRPGAEDVKIRALEVALPSC